MKAQSFTEDLRALADFLDANPGLDVSRCVTFYVWATRDNFAEQMRLLGGTIADPVVKYTDSKFLNAARKFGEIEVQVTIPKTESCERRQVGVRQVEQPVVIETGETEIIDEPVFEWICPPAWSQIGSAS